MAQVTTISLNQFSHAVQSAVKAAIAKNPKFKGEPPPGVTFSHLIWGYPAEEALLKNITLGETQTFADEIAGHLGSSKISALAGAKPGSKGVFYSAGSHIIIGIPPMEAVRLEE